MIRFACILLPLLTLTGQSSAQVNPQFADVNDDIEMVRSLVRLERKVVIERGMGFSPAESQAFWPIYTEYETERTAINDRKVKLITDYAAVYPDLSDERAKALLADFFKVESDTVDLRQKYARRLGKVLPATRVARFIQLESKLDALINLSLAEQIPLVL